MTSNERPQLTRLVAGADGDLDQFLSDRLDEHNAAATQGIEPARELTVQVRGTEGDVLGGVSGWTWGDASGMGMLWVHPDHRGTGVGSLLIRDFEAEAKRRGCTHIFVTSFTFQAPAFYATHGYEEIFRWEGVPTPDQSDIHLRKNLS